MNGAAYFMMKARLRAEALLAAEPRRECPYCQQPYRVSESVRHLNTRECLAAQKALRNAK